MVVHVDNHHYNSDYTFCLLIEPTVQNNTILFPHTTVFDFIIICSRWESRSPIRITSYGTLAILIAKTPFLFDFISVFINFIEFGVFPNGIECIAHAMAINDDSPELIS